MDGIDPNVPPPPQAYGAPPDAFPPPNTKPEAPMPQMPPMPRIGEPGGFGQFAFRMADMIRRYGQRARQNNGS
jgi:hypothetical protein